MAGPSLIALLSPKSESLPAVHAICESVGGGICVFDVSGKLLLGGLDAQPEHGDENGADQVPVTLDEATLGFVRGPAGRASAVALLLRHLASRERRSRALGGEVLHLYRQVHLIEQLSEQLVALLDLSAVAESALGQAQRLIPATRGGILVMDPADGSLRDRASFGGCPLTPESQFAHSIRERGVAEIVNDCAEDPRALELECGLGALICAPMRAGQRTVGLIALAHTKPYSAADLKLLNTIALQTAAAIENSLLCAEMVDAARDREHLISLQKEMDTGRSIQHLLVPSTFPPFPERTDFDIHAQMTSARAVGGDFFDFFLIGEDHIGLVIGDVSGKGIPAALFMAVTRTQLKTTALRGMPPAECLHEVNHVLVKESVDAMFATCFYGVLNLRSGAFEYCSAGHNPPYILRAAGGEVEPVNEGGGIPLGIFEGMGYGGGTACLHAGDVLFLYTDGVPEAQNGAQEDFSDERLVAMLGAGRRLGCQELIHHVTGEVSAFTKGAPQSDDITMLCVRRL